MHSFPVLLVPRVLRQLASTCRFHCIKAMPPGYLVDSLDYLDYNVRQTQVFRVRRSSYVARNSPLNNESLFCPTDRAHCRLRLIGQSAFVPTAETGKCSAGEQIKQAENEPTQNERRPR